MLSDEIFFQIHLAHGAPIVQQTVIAITGDKNMRNNLYQGLLSSNKETAM
jgi:hypothetical protein